VCNGFTIEIISSTEKTVIVKVKATSQPPEFFVNGKFERTFCDQIYDFNTEKTGIGTS
jgi:hypothetical protein